jgi:hypothetical protein
MMALNQSCVPLGKRRERAWLLLGPFSCLRLYLQGGSDGAKGLRLDKHDWTLSSPFVVCEQRREQQFAAKRRLRLEELAAGRSIELDIVQNKTKALELDIANAQAEIRRLRGMSGQDEVMLDWRGPGEQWLDEDIVRHRRHQEHQRQLEHQLKPLTARIKAAEEQLTVLRGLSIELQATIVQARQRAERAIEQRARRTELRLALYCQAVFKAGIKIDRREQRRRERKTREQEKRERKMRGREGRGQAACEQGQDGCEWAGHELDGREWAAFEQADCGQGRMPGRSGQKEVDYGSEPAV